MPIWKQHLTLEQLTRNSADTAVSHLGIEFTEMGDDFLRARVPVDARTRQPYGILHGGVSVVLAETLGSTAASLAIPAGWRCVGLQINANHIRAARQGWVVATARALHLGHSTHVWSIELRDEDQRLTCQCTLTMAVLAPTQAQHAKVQGSTA